MPARKSDAARSDVTAARFVPTIETDPAAMVIDAAPSVTYTLLPSRNIDAATTESARPPSSSAGGDPRASVDRKDKDGAITIEQLQLPKSIIQRLAKGVLPPNTQIQANATLALTQGATVFISHLANAANEFTQMANKKTIMPQEVFQGLEEIGMGFMREQLEAEFQKFADTQSTKRSTYRRKVAAARKAAGGADASGMGESSMMSFTSANEAGDEHENDDNESGAPAHSLETGDVRLAKKMKAGGPGHNPDEPSDAETVMDDQTDEEDDSADEEEEEEEEEEEDEGGETQGGADTQDRLEERSVREDGDEALDDGDSD